MSKRLERYTHSSNFRASEDEIRERYSERIYIFYGFDNYECNLTHIKELSDAIRKEYPDTTDKDINICFVEQRQSISHAGFTTLGVAIPVEDFLRMRQNHEIKIL